MVTRRNLEGLWDADNHGSHAVVIAGLIGQQVMIKDTHYGSTVTVENIDTLVYNGHKVGGQAQSFRAFLLSAHVATFAGGNGNHLARIYS